MDASKDRLTELVRPFKGKNGVTIPVLQAIQEEFGYLPEGSFDVIEEELSIPASKAYGVATFYAQFRLDPVGKHLIKVCDGTACHVKGSETILSSLRDHLKLEDGDTTGDLEFTMEEVACLGCCSLAPVMMIDDRTYGTLTIEKMKKIINDIRERGDGNG